MGRRLSDSRRQALTADISARLPTIHWTGDKLKPAQAITAGEAIGRLFRRDATSEGVGQTPKAVLKAMHDLALAQAEDRRAREGGSSSDAVSRWIDAYVNPASPTALEGSDRLWTTALAYQRDLDRRRRHQSDGAGPVKLALSATYGGMLADLQRDAGGKSARATIENLIEAAHSRRTARARRSAPAVQQLSLLDEAPKPKKRT